MKQTELNFFRRLLENAPQEILEEAERALGSMNTKAQEPTPIPRIAPRWNPIAIFCCGCAIGSASF